MRHKTRPSSSTRLLAHMTQVRTLLETFDVTLIGYGSGVRGHWHRPQFLMPLTIELDHIAWTWLEPLLCELCERRAHDERYADTGEDPDRSRS